MSAKFAKDFLSVRTIKDACKSVTGELPEVSTELATYSYGNREVIVSPADETIEEFSMFVDSVGDRHTLVHDGEVSLRCQMHIDCESPVSHIDAKGFIYCEGHGKARSHSVRCRRLTPKELRDLKQSKQVKEF